MDISIVIPCRDEADNVPILVQELGPVLAELRRSHLVQLVLVDDGSTDGTGDLLEDSFGQDELVRIVRLNPGRGLGGAIRTGFAHSRGEVIVVTDCDASYPFTLIPRLLERLEPDVDIVTASCYHPDGGVENVPGYRIFLSRSASLMYRVLLDWRVHTYTCMFRAYRRDVVERIPYQSDGFLSMAEILAKAMLAGFTVDEFPCTLRARRYGASKARVARIIQSHLAFQWWIVKARLLHRQRRLVPSRPAAQIPCLDGDNPGDQPL